MENNITYTISLYSENNVGLLNRVSAILLKRHINIESFSTSPSEIPNVFRFVIVVRLPEEKIKKVVQQIEKQIDVIKAFYHSSNESRRGVTLDVARQRLARPTAHPMKLWAAG